MTSLAIDDTIVRTRTKPWARPSTRRPARMPRRDLVHRARQCLGRQECLLKKEVGKGGHPALVVAELADPLSTERLDAVALLLGIDETVLGSVTD
jgi:hypothetical protein